MDTLAHGVMGAVMFSRSGVAGLICRRYGIAAERHKGFDWTIVIAAGAGFMPDLIAFGYYTFERIINNRFITGPPALREMPSYIFQSYTVTHSLLTALVLIIISRIMFKKVWPAMLAWPLHVLCDIPLHSYAFFPTPFLYPFSDWVFDGWPLVKKLWLAAGYWVIIILLCVLVHLYHEDIKQRLKRK